MDIFNDLQQSRIYNFSNHQLKTRTNTASNVPGFRRRYYDSRNMICNPNSNLEFKHPSLKDRWRVSSGIGTTNPTEKGRNNKSPAADRGQLITPISQGWVMTPSSSFIRSTKSFERQTESLRRKRSKRKGSKLEITFNSHFKDPSENTTNILKGLNDIILEAKSMTHFNSDSFDLDTSIVSNPQMDNCQLINCSQLDWDTEFEMNGKHY